MKNYNIIFSELAELLRLQEVTTVRVDSTALKKELPEIAARYTVTTTTKRFNFS